MRGWIVLFTKVVLFSLYFFFGHILIFGVLLFATPFMIGETDIAYDVEDILAPSEATTYATLLDDRAFSLETRIALIETAETTAYVSTFSTTAGETKDIVFGALFAAAERGVEVRILIDALSRYGTEGDYAKLRALAVHENIEVRIYEPFNFLLPYTLHNRFHDKMFIIDGEYATSGGRNIADRYFLDDEHPDEGSYDRDVLVFGEMGTGHPTVRTMEDYFFEVFHHDFSHPLKSDRLEAALIEEMVAAYTDYTTGKDLPGTMEDIRSEAVEVGNATFVRGPIERGKKYPVVLETLAALAETEDEWFIQSPFIAFSDPMRAFLPDHEDKAITFLTNNIADSPNPYVRGAYLHHREDLAEIGTIYEFQSTANIHAKTMVFGDTISVIGAFNLDPRSTFLSTENMVVLVGEDFTTQLQSVLEDYLERSLEVRPDGSFVERPDLEPLEPTLRRRVSLRFTYFIAYFFDFML